MLRKVAMQHLVAQSSLQLSLLNAESGGGGGGRGALGAAAAAESIPLQLEQRIGSAFDEAVAPDEETGQLPDKKTAWVLFLRNCSVQHVMLPTGVRQAHGGSYVNWFHSTRAREMLKCSTRV